jgi:Ca2+-binding RTX toxin-like protein
MIKSSSMTSTKANAMLSAVQGENLIVNGRFEQNVKNWLTSAGSSNGMASNGGDWTNFVEDEANGIDNIPGWTTAQDVWGDIGNIDIWRSYQRFANTTGKWVDLGGLLPASQQPAGTPGAANGYLLQTLTTPTTGPSELLFDYAEWCGIPQESDFAVFINGTVVAAFIKASLSSDWVFTDLTGGLINISSSDKADVDGTDGWQIAKIQILEAFGPVSSIGFQAGGWNGTSFDPRQQVDPSGTALANVSLFSMITGQIFLGTSGADTLLGGVGDDTVNGRAGDDSMAGGKGDDTYIVDSAGDIVTESLRSGSDTVQSSVSRSLENNVENLTLVGAAALNGTGNALNNLITGNRLANNLLGLAGNDTLSGEAGADTLDGGTGSDSLSGGAGDDTYVTDGGDTITEASAGGTDLVQSSISYSLGANLENLTLTGNAAITGTGNALNNVISGNVGNNTLNGGAGADTLQGGAGNDTYEVDSAGDVVVENAGEGIDLVRASVTYTLQGNLENLTLTGLGAIDGTGNALANTITGNGGANVLVGKEGADTIIGGAGDDTLEGGSGTDSLVGGTGDDIYEVDRAGDTVVETLGQGTDTVLATFSYTLGANLESLQLGGSEAINGTGNSLGNEITGNSRANSLTGLDGNDTLYGESGDDSLSGGAGNDSLIGGIGSDTLNGGVGADTFVFADLASVDTISDFKVGEDRIGLYKAGMGSLGAPGNLRAGAFWSGSDAVSGHDSTDRIIYNTSTGAVYYDADGSGSGAAVQFALVTGAPNLGFGDFLII